MFKEANQSTIDLAPCLYVTTADNCNSSSINCNYGKKFDNEILAIHMYMYAQKTNYIRYHSYNCTFQASREWSFGKTRCCLTNTSESEAGFHWGVNTHI